MRAKLLDTVRDPNSPSGVKKKDKKSLKRLYRAEEGFRPAAGRPRKIEDELSVVRAKAVHTTFEAQKIKYALTTKTIGEIFHVKDDYFIRILIKIETKALDNEENGISRISMDEVMEYIENEVTSSEPLDFAVMVLAHMYEATEPYVRRKLGQALIEDLTGPIVAHDEQRIINEHELYDIYDKTIDYGKDTPPSRPDAP